MRPSNMFKSANLFLVLSILTYLLPACQNSPQRQNPWDKMASQPASLDLDAGTRSFNIGDLQLELANSSQTITRLSPLEETTFDFTPGDRLEYRDIDSCYHLGDINFTLKTQEGWKDYSCAGKRKNIAPMSVRPHQIAMADLQPTLGEDLPVKVIRSWENNDGTLNLRFTFTNTSMDLVEIGSLGIPMIFNNILSGKSLEETHVENVFYDPYIGKDAGYLQVVRLHGKGSVLLVVPEKGAGFEAYNPLNDDPTPRGITFEGFHEWMVHSKSHAENEWKDAEPWNEPTSRILTPGESMVYGLKFVLAPSVKDIEATLQKIQKPVAVGVPGYVLPTDAKGKLFIKYPEKIAKIDIYPEDALTIESTKPQGEWTAYEVSANSYGRSRVTITYEDKTTQTIQYKGIHSERQTVKNMGSFFFNQQWYDDKNDPFGRSPGIMTYDYEDKKILTEDSRAWIVGMGDEGGSGPYLAAFMKQLVYPDQKEIEQLSRFVDETLWGGIQYNEGPKKYGVRKSLFYYEPDSMPAGTYSDSVNYKTWAAWNKEHAETTERSYNYPHVTAAHWVMYRLARYRQRLVSNHSWEWYLENAYHTAQAMIEQAPHYAQFGQMEGTVFVLLLKDLQREGLNEMATQLEATMKKRADLWKSLAYPFGSEMPWDSTGQEEVYMWSKYFGFDDKAQVTLNAILAYMPTVPHWGYNGSARRYWDFLYGGKLSRVERQLHHYGSALNAIPVLDAYSDTPDDLYLLRVGYAGMLGGIANVTSDGFGSAAFHSYPSTLAIDGISGDYGTGFFGYAINNSSFLINDPTFGWLGFGGNVSTSGDWVTLELTSATRSKVLISPAQVEVSLFAGDIKYVSFNKNSGKIRIGLAPSDQNTPTAYLNINSNSPDQQYQLVGKPNQDLQNLQVTLGETVTVLELEGI